MEHDCRNKSKSLFIIFIKVARGQSANCWLSACCTFSGEQNGLFSEVSALGVEKSITKSTEALLSGFLTFIYSKLEGGW